MDGFGEDGLACGFFMARILIGTVPARGHVNPLVAIARRLVEHGHEVAWITHRKFRNTIESAHVRFVEPRESCGFDEENLERSFPTRPKAPGLTQLKFDLKHVFIDDAAAQLQDLAAFAKAFRPELVLADAAYGGARLFGELSGTPQCVLGVIPMTLGGDDVAPFGFGLGPSRSFWGRLRNRILHALTQRILFADVQRHYDVVRARVGLGRASRWVLDGPVDCNLYLQPSIPAFEYPRREMPKSVHFIGALPIAAPSSWAEPSWWSELEGGRPVVHVTQGTLSNAQPVLIGPALEGLATEDVLVVVSTGGRPPESLGLGSLPANVRLSTFLSYPALLPRTQVFLTNGGYGGVQAALSHGIPVVVAGRTEDKAEVAARVAWSGAGLNLKTSTPRPQTLRAAVRRVLDDPSFTTRAKALEAEYRRHDALARAVELIGSLANSGTSPETSVPAT